MEDKQLPRFCIMMYVEDVKCEYYNKKNALCSRDWEDPCIKINND